MPNMWTREDFQLRLGRRSVIGMVHLRALPGSPLARSLDDVAGAAASDLRSLEAAGVDAVMVENFGDRPFFASRVPLETVASMTRVLTELRSISKIPIGVNVLRNDGHAALVIAHAVAAMFIRVNVLVGAMLTDQGTIEGEAASLLRRRRELGSDVAIFGDHLVKHAVPLAPHDPLQLAKDLRLRGLADAVVISGRETGAAADPSMIGRLREAIDAPIVVGSGMTEMNAGDYGEADGVIVGTAIKMNGDVDQPVDAARAERFIRAFKRG